MDRKNKIIKRKIERKKRGSGVNEEIKKKPENKNLKKIKKKNVKLELEERNEQLKEITMEEIEKTAVNNNN